MAVLMLNLSRTISSSAAYPLQPNAANRRCFVVVLPSLPAVCPFLLDSHQITTLEAFTFLFITLICLFSLVDPPMSLCLVFVYRKFFFRVFVTFPLWPYATSVNLPCERRRILVWIRHNRTLCCPEWRKCILKVTWQNNLQHNSSRHQGKLGLTRRKDKK